MYAKNAASPQRIALGPVVQISDGAVQTSGVSVKVMPQGGAASAGGNSPAYEEGIVLYTPTQAETNYASFMVIAYKTGCIPVAVTIVTTASAVAGYAGLDWAVINAPTTSNALTGTTIATTQKVDIETIKTNPVVNAGTVTFPTTATLASTTNITAATGITVSTNSDKTGYGLSSAAVQAIWDALTSALTTVGSIGKKLADWTIGTAQTGDSFARLGAPAGASVSADIAAVKVDTAAILVDTAEIGAAGAGLTALATQASVNALPSAAANADAVWDEAIAGHATAGSTGKALIDASAAGNPWASLTASNTDAGSFGLALGTTLQATEAAIKAKTDNLPAAPAAVGDIPSAATVATAVLTTAMTESYRADGATGTLAQMQYEMIAHLGESSINLTTKTIKKVDGTTTAATFSLDDATTPTSITRAS